MVKLSQQELLDFGKVAVLKGGQSAEREISLISGGAVFAALKNVGVDVYQFDYDKYTLAQLIDGKFDRVFIALHGRGGEDGKIQGALESIGLPYTGSGVLGSALAMDKIRSKAIWQQFGLSVPKAIELNTNSNWQAVAEELGLPIMVKPVNEGSSIGASKVVDANDLKSAWEQAVKFDDRVMAESWVSGSEYTVPILGREVLPPIKLETKRDFYDYQAKYVDDDTKYICPCGLSEEKINEMGQLALAACDTIDVSGWARVDMMLDKSNQPYLIEVNTVPGMTSHSLVPMAAKQVGISFENLVVKILTTCVRER